MARGSRRTVSPLGARSELPAVTDATGLALRAVAEAWAALHRAAPAARGPRSKRSPAPDTPEVRRARVSVATPAMLAPRD